MTKSIVRIGTEEEFFKRGRTIARRADQSLAIEAENLICFEDPDEMEKFLATAPVSTIHSTDTQSDVISTKEAIK